MKKAIISRTFVSSIVYYKAFDMDKAELYDGETYIPAQYDSPEKAEKFLRKNGDILVKGKLVMVSDVQRSELLCGMYLDDFIANAKPVSERSKETRGTVTKTVQSCLATALYMVDDHFVKTTTINFPVGLNNVDAYVRKNWNGPGVFITVKDVRTVESLYSMTENEFLALAKPMKNKFQLAD